VALVIRETTAADLPDLEALWADGEVMRYVGFPEGIHHGEDDLRHWLERLQASPDCRHFVVHDDEVGFCGELFYRIHERGRVELDVKLRPAARGRGVATEALSRLVDHVFATVPEAELVYVEPVPENVAAHRLYARCGLEPGERPADLPPGPSFWSRAKKMPPPTNP
jgi:RimJ/RimL family protein N-acetyltransferase